jgi:hypothetical protein
MLYSTAVMRFTESNRIEPNPTQTTAASDRAPESCPRIIISGPGHSELSSLLDRLFQASPTRVEHYPNCHLGASDRLLSFPHSSKELSRSSLSILLHTQSIVLFSTGASVQYVYIIVPESVYAFPSSSPSAGPSSTPIGSPSMATSSSSSSSSS